MYRLSTPQKNVWNLRKYYPGTGITNICGSVLFHENMELSLLDSAIREAVKSQGGLRLRFVETEAGPMEEEAKYEPFSIDYKSFNSVEELRTYAEKLARIPILLNDGFLFKFTIFDMGGRQGILLCADHLISDAWTISLLAKQIYSIYCALKVGESIDCKEYSYQIALKLEEKYLASKAYERDKNYWTGEYDGFSGIAEIKSVTGLNNNPKANRLTTVIDKKLSEEICRFESETGYSPAVVFEAAIATYLSRINHDTTSISLGLAVLNRSNSVERRTAGMFVSTIPMRISIQETMRVSEMFESLAEKHMGIFRHQRYPYSEIITDVRSHCPDTNALYDVIVSYQNAVTEIPADTCWYFNGFCEVPLEVHIDKRDGTNTYTFNMDYQTAVFSDKEIKLLRKRILHIIRQIISNAEMIIRDLSIIPAEEERLLLVEFNDTAIAYPKEKCIHELFSLQVKKTPDKTALVFGDERFSYTELDQMSNAVCNYLRERSIPARSIVAIAAERDWRVVVAMIGIMKAGCAYLPIDISLPTDRITYMLDTAKCHCALTYRNTATFNNIEKYPIDEAIRTGTFEAVAAPISSEDICYVLFTSGSTGRPKAVAITHSNLGNFTDNNSNNIYQCAMVNSCHSVLADTTFVFDISVFEIFLALLNGLKVVLTGGNTSALHLASLIEKEEVDVFHSTPTKIEMLMQSDCFCNAMRYFRMIMVGAEEFPLSLFNRIKEHTRATVYNGYGPTETTIGVTFKRVNNDVIATADEVVTREDITLGKPIANTQIYILGNHQELLPLGIAGELCISGAGVGNGYLNRPDLTAESFITNPFATIENSHGPIMYKTGDLARWRVNGELEYLGRIDTQVKIRGLRIELSEIENVMASFTGIQMVAVSDKKDYTGRQYLVGYYTSKKVIDEKVLRRYLGKSLPKYMVPNYFIQLDTMPMTPSGKTDRKNLPNPEFIQLKREYIAPVDGIEKKLAELWSNLFKIKQISRDDDFFELGGDSLLAITLMAEIEKQFQINISVKDVMEYTVLKEMAEYISNSSEEYLAIPTGNRFSYSLLPQQLAIYSVCSRNPYSLAYNMPCRIELPANIDRDHLKYCLRKLLEIHPELNTTIKIKNGVPTAEYSLIVNLSFEEYTDMDYSGFVRPFDLSSAPLLRVGFTETALLLDSHHIIMDGSSLTILLKDLSILYEGGKVEPALHTYADYVAYFQSKDFSAHRAYFAEYLKYGIQPIILPEKKNTLAQGGSSIIFTISEKQTRFIRDYCSEHHLTETMVCLAAYGILLKRYTNEENITTGVVVANRGHNEIQHMVGMFVNTIPVSFPEIDDTEEFLQHVKENVMNLYKYQELPYLEIVKAASISNLDAINTSFIYQAYGKIDFSMEQQNLELYSLATRTTKFDLSIEITPVDEIMQVRLEYDTAKYDEGLIRRMFDSYCMILHGLQQKRLSDIKVISAEETNRMLLDFNQTANKYPREKCVHELFSLQAKKTPDQIALVFEDRRFSYRELEKLCNSLAHYLRDVGVQRGDIVPIIAHRSWHIIVAMIGVLKAGAAYMPVDPTYPIERINEMILPARSHDPPTSRASATVNARCISLDKFDFCNVDDGLECINDANDLCYVIFTSGSTGKPKGVTITHRNVSNYCHNNKNNIVCHRVLTDGNRSIVSVTNFIFDIFVTESLLPLLNGITVYFANDTESISQKHLSKLIEKNTIDIIQTTPTKMRSLIADKSDIGYLKNIKTLILGGEAFPLDLAHELQSNTSARVFNIYGPAETTVWSTNSEVQYGKGDITIGKPIANTQIYILDKKNKPLPLGVAGELCISGDGVGKGYLNSPDLTKERFIPNPFATVENGHGSIMYRTGDLARWRVNGEIEYLGRIDTQVKIRGLRIELSEIESVLASYPGLQLVAVTEKKDVTERQYLVGYYTADQNVDEKKLRSHLGKTLPKYMVPNYFMHLDTMPMTPSGKIDRKNLPVPEFSLSDRDYVSPTNENEEILCVVLENLFQLERIGITDDFFELGGDSLKAIEYVAKAHSQGIDFALQSVFDYPTVQLLWNHIVVGDIENLRYSNEEFEKYIPLLSNNVIDEQWNPKKKDLGAVLVTGATGFLGAHVIDVFLRNEVGKLYCLVRGSEDRLKDTLHYYFGERYDSWFGNRIICIIGDITDENLDYILPGDIQTIIHTAATVSHYGTYSFFKKINVTGTANIAKCAYIRKARLFHISTVSVSGIGFDDYDRNAGLQCFDECCLYSGQSLNNVYVRSKFEAECVVLDAMQKGLDAHIIRVGMLTNRTSDYKFQFNYRSNDFLNRLKAGLEYGFIPDYLLQGYLEFSPVDYTASGILLLAQYAEHQSLFHLYNNKLLKIDDYVSILRNMRIKMEVMEGNEFNLKLQGLMDNKSTEYIYKAFQNDLDSSGNLLFGQHANISNDFTVWFMKKLGFEWIDIDQQYIAGYIKYFRDLGYFDI